MDLKVAERKGGSLCLLLPVRGGSVTINRDPAGESYTPGFHYNTGAKADQDALGIIFARPRIIAIQARDYYSLIEALRHASQARRLFETGSWEDADREFEYFSEACRGVLALHFPPSRQ